jgi:hypothetical protein
MSGTTHCVGGSKGAFAAVPFRVAHHCNCSSVVNLTRAPDDAIRHKDLQMVIKDLHVAAEFVATSTQAA